MTGAVAHADAPDDQFLKLLAKDGINAGPPEQLIALAHERCDGSCSLIKRTQLAGPRSGGPEAEPLFARHMG